VGLGQRCDECPPGHGLVVDDVVRLAGSASFQRRHGGCRGVVNMDPASGAALAPRQGKASLAQQFDEQIAEGPRTVEDAVPKRDSLNALGVEHLVLGGV
jgi:hypothetical protein